MPTIIRRFFNWICFLLIVVTITFTSKSAAAAGMAAAGVAGGVYTEWDVILLITYILLALPYERAWASVGRALEKSGFEITDRDRSAGAYYVRLVGLPTEEDDGWFDWLFGGDDDEALAGKEYIVQTEARDEESVTIRLRPQDASAPLEKQEEQGLLVLIKGSIQ